MVDWQNVEDQPRNPPAAGTPVVEAAEPPAPDTTTTDLATDPATPATRSHSATKTAIEWTLLVAAALIIAVLIKAFLFQAFYIPSDSMVPTLKTNDRVIVNKLSYHLHGVHRGDVVVFTTPKGPDGKPIDPTIKDLVKRVIGLPGDVISAKNDQITINGKVLKESYLSAGTVSNCTSFKAQCFPKGAIPANHYFVMGDNRRNSRDSRYFGAIPKSEIVGRAFVRVWPLDRLGLL